MLDYSPCPEVALFEWVSKLVKCLIAYEQDEKQHQEQVMTHGMKQNIGTTIV